MLPENVVSVCVTVKVMVPDATTLLLAQVPYQIWSGVGESKGLDPPSRPQPGRKVRKANETSRSTMHLFLMLTPYHRYDSRLTCRNDYPEIRYTRLSRKLRLYGALLPLHCLHYVIRHAL